MMDKLIAGAAKLGLELSSHQQEQFHLFYQELIEWNQKLNLTAIINYEEVQIKHFLDSLTVTLAVGETPDVNFKVIDIGTGAGMPGIPLKILWPQINLVLLDSTAKKTVFLRHLVGVLGLSNVSTVVGRAEEVAHQAQYREQFNMVLSRAVALLPALVELTLPFCAVGGRFVAQKKRAIEAEINQAGKAIAMLGGKLREIKRVDLDEFDDDRYLVVIDKVMTTPETYPRRPGIPSKRPLIDKQIKQ